MVFGGNYPMSSKCVYFMRTVPEGVPVKLDVWSNEELLFGELNGSPMDCLSAALTGVFVPYVESNSEKALWGAAGDEMRSEFVSQVSKFTTEMAQIIESLSGGIELMRSDEINAIIPGEGSVINLFEFMKDPKHLKLIPVAEQLMEAWTKQIEAFIDATVDLGSSEKESEDPGPRTELDYWRTRMQRIASITEQLKTLHCRTVLGILHFVNTARTGHPHPQQVELDKARVLVSGQVRRWKLLEISVHEAAAEARDNVKYLSSLDKNLEPLYSGTLEGVIENLPGLMNGVKMVNSIARFYNTNERMTQLLGKITNQMITLCKTSIKGTSESPWDQPMDILLAKLAKATELNTAYQREYHATKKSLQSDKKVKQFDFNEISFFGKFDLFNRRISKLNEMFGVIAQFEIFASHKFDGMEVIVDSFRKLKESFRDKRHDLLDYHVNRFDRDYVEFTQRIGAIETDLRLFVNKCFEQNESIEGSLRMLSKFKGILTRDSLKKDVDAKYFLIFHNYSQELLRIQDMYEKYKSNPPIGRDLPPVAGNISWSRHLLKRIEDPMKLFQTSSETGGVNVFAGKDGKTTVKLYNRLAKTLIEFETVWYQAWVNSIDDAKSGLKACLIVRHPQDSKLYVNMDPEILQLIREAKILDRMGIEIPDSARIVLFQEKKYKTHYGELEFVLKEYKRVTGGIRSILARLLKPHVDFLDLVMRPGMTTLSWTSLNIDSFIESVWHELARLERLVSTVNDFIDNRIEKNLKQVSKILLVQLPVAGQTVSLDQFVEMQEKLVSQSTAMLVSKSNEIETAVNDLLGVIVGYKIDSSVVTGVAESELVKLKAHYNWSMYHALLGCTRRSLLVLKNRMSIRAGKRGLYPPMFEVGMQLDGVGVRLTPSLEDIQVSVNEGAVAILKCSKMVEAWDTCSIPHNVAAILSGNSESGSPLLHSSSAAQGTFYDRIVQDKEILKTILVLTGSVQSSRGQTAEYLSQFAKYAWLWRDHIVDSFRAFSKGPSDLGRLEQKLREFASLRDAFAEPKQFPSRQIAALSVKTEGLTKSLGELCKQWTVEFAKELHKDAKSRLESMTERIKQTMKRMNRAVDDGDIEALGFVMSTLNDVRRQQSDIEMEFNPIFYMYSILDQYLPPSFFDKDEQDMRSLLKANWGKLVDECNRRQSDLSAKQAEYKRTLISTISTFKKDVRDLRTLYEEKGPMVPGIEPKEAVERLKRFKEEFEVRSRKEEIYKLGENLFGLDHQQYPQLDQTRKELGYLSQLYDLYVHVLETIKVWKDLLWVNVAGEIESMRTQVEIFSTRCRKMPKQLKEWPAYHELKQEIDEFSDVLPLLTELAKKSVLPRHWVQLTEITKVDLPVESEGFRLQGLIDANLNRFRDEIIDICDSADKQLVIERKILEIQNQWSSTMFDFNTWKTREYPCVLAGGRVAEIQEQLEESMMTLNTMNAMRHSTPFKTQLGELLSSLSDTMEMIERWTKVQLLWTGLESVFTGGDIAKQMPIEAKKFQHIDKDWSRIMAKSAEIRLVVPCCQNEILKQLLPVLGQGLEQCQKSLESYLEGKRNKFPRFYFVSDPVLLKILSQGGDPQSVQEDLEKLFDAISRLEFDKVDKRKILKIKGIVGNAEEFLDLSAPLMATGNIEDWLCTLEQEMQKAVRRECRAAASQTGSVMSTMTLKEFADKFIAQVALLGIQIIWTADFQETLSRMGKDKSILATTNRKFQQMLSDLVAVCLTDLGSRMNRTKFETLVTIHVHQRDLFTEIWKKVKEHKVKDESDFEWLKQTRFYWRTETDHAIVSIADVDSTYSYEYLGVKERLVITPLTDRCYLTLSQALGICYGGAPAGPAGTGKTETVKDMARSLGLYCVVTNCSDQHRYKDMAKIFKGLCSSGIFGCFDEFNRIDLEVLSVVAMQVEAITLAKKQHAKTFMFPGEAVPIRLVPSVGYFITMNPGYAGRQELPENLKNLFRSVSMMIPDREIIMRVKLASVGYSQMDLLGKKFNVLYQLCEQQLSKQRHYDFGLRNILSVLRTAGGVKRSEPPDADEEMIFMRTVRDMNLSKLVADDVPLFLALLKDLFPRVADPPKKTYFDIEEGIGKLVKQRKLVMYEPWKLKVIQLYETSLVRHGLMLVGPSLCGKSEIMNILTTCLSEYAGSPHRIVSLNPKAITDAQMYGVKDPLSEEWTPGVFASIWQKFNNRSLKYTTWIVCDGPVDAIWIENLNSVLDDNKILTLANNDRIPMTDNCRILFEVENLNNASPATVSRAGIIFVSGTDLDWSCLVDSWLAHRNDDKSGPNMRDTEIENIRSLVDKWIKTPDLFDWMKRNLNKWVMTVNDSTVIVNFLNLLTGLLKAHLDNNEILAEPAYQRVVLYCLAWSFGGLLESEDRTVFTTKIFEIVTKSGLSSILPSVTTDAPTIFEFWPDNRSKDRPWSIWKPEKWVAPPTLQFSSLLIPTMDSVRSEFLISTIASLDRSRFPPSFKSTLLLGASGTAKTSTVQMYLSKLNADTVISKRINLSSATTPLRFQKSVELELERKTGKTFCPPNGKKMVMFIDDMSLPLVNKWGDQVTLEILRQLMETSGFYFLDKDKRGDFKSVEQIEYIGSMVNPGGGRNDIPNRVKSKFFSFSMVMPGITVVDSIYGSILRARFNAKNGCSESLGSLVGSLTSGTIDVWERVKKSLLPTPQRFHYVFNMRELSRVFQGVLDAPLQVVSNEATLVSLWRHECTRVFSDKLARQFDKDTVSSIISEVTASRFPAFKNDPSQWWADFQRDAPPSADDGDELPAPKIYEPVVSMDRVRAKAYEFLHKYNEQFPSRVMSLVLFDDALSHLMKVVRILQQKRGSAMLVGVGGSGKQSLTRLAAFICRQRSFRIAITKSYNENAFFDDLRALFVDCGQKNNPVTFLLTDSDIKTEEFLEHMNSVMATGEVAGLFQKDERDSMCAEIRNDFLKDRPGQEDSMLNLQQYFVDRLRDNLHVVFCFSPINSKFAVRAQKFPAIFAAANINWFLPWPEAALTAVSSTFLSQYEIDTPTTARDSLYEWLGSAHAAVNDVCNLYYQVMRRRVYVTPKNFLCLIDFYKQLYAEKYREVNELERSVNVGLTKLNEAAADVEKLKIDLRVEEQNLKIAETETNSLLAKVQSETVKAESKAAEVGKQKDECLAKKSEIEREQADAERDLQAALPFLHEAENAVKSITAKDITELKTLKQPSDIIRLVFDGLLLLQQKRVCEVQSEPKSVNKQTFDFIHDSYDEIAKGLLTDIRFLPDLFEFSEKQKDNINDETCELLEPYLSLPNFNPAVAKKASGAAEGLCKWVGAMVMYHEAAKIVKPKMDYLKIQGAKLEAAMTDLAAAERELAAVMAVLSDLNASFKEAMERKTTLETRANATRRKMDQAEKLINGLAGEKIRWTQDSLTFAERRRNLVGDVGLAAVFVTYCGAFNAEFREKLMREYLIPGLVSRGVAHSRNLDIVKFMIDQATIGEWALEGLPSDDLSIQNGIMVTKSGRFPLMIDPQGQAVRWIKQREAKRIASNPSQCVTTLANPRLKDQLEFTMGEGLCLLIENVENEVDPILDPVLDRAIVKKGRNLVITVSDQVMDYNPKFSLYLTSRLPNPHFSPELCASCAVIDFTVTLRGLEQQLLGRVLAMEQKALEDSLVMLMEEVTRNTKSLQLLDSQLLERLSNSSGNLLDDLELIEVLANTKQTAKEVEQKLKDAEEKKSEINVKREQYRPVATRGSVMYFCMTDMTLISNPVTLQPTGWMYNCSLVQFLAQFDLSVRNSEKSQVTNKRVEKIIDYLTYQVYRYMNRGLFERDKTLFKLMLAMRIQTVSGELSQADVGLLLRGGSALDIKSEKPSPFKWMPDKVWLNLVQLSRHVFAQKRIFGDLIEKLTANESAWRKWYDDNDPENCPVPDYEELIAADPVIGPFIRCALVRCVREDRVTIAAAEYITQQLDSRFSKPVTDSIESVYAESSSRKPIIYLLSSGSDPTWMIDELAKKKKRFPTDKVSMGEGQEVIAWDRMRSGFLTGSWVVLQNCHLGLGFMNQLEEIFTKTKEIDDDFRLWITCEVTSKFPIGLLQMSIKVTMEPPMGLKAGLHRTYTTTVSQEIIDKIDHEKWRRIVYITAFLHSIVQERRKFGPIGWCVPYEFNNSDMEASLLFLEKHLATTVMVGQPLSWTTIQYMIAEVQYGGRITDDLDRELFNTYAFRWLCEEAMKVSGFTFGTPQYIVPEGAEVSMYKDQIELLPPVDSPVIFGLHPNADLTYRQLEASMLLSTIQETQPKEGASSSGGKTRDELVKEKALEILSKMPPDFVEEVYRAQIAKHKGPPGTSDKGFQAPLNIFLFQELERLQRVISIVRSNLTNLVMAIDGTVVMTPELVEDLNMIYDARIPRSWTHDASGSEISWLQPSLGSWFTGLLDRVQQLTTWLENGRGAMKAFWFPGFLNPQGFLTAMRQEVTRQHKKDQWALDDVVTHTQVVNVDSVDKIREPPEEGQNIYGLSLEGARWGKGEGKLEESEAKKLFTSMPIIHVTAVTAKEKKTRGADYGPFGPFDCPVYKYPKRTDKYLIFRMNLKTDLVPSHWKLRGVCCLCSTE